MGESKHTPGPWQEVGSDHVNDQVAAVMHPAPWRVEAHARLNRARIIDRDGEQVMSGINILKARIIVSGVNRAAHTAKMLEALQPFVQHYELNDLHERSADDALEIPVRDIVRASKTFKNVSKAVS